MTFKITLKSEFGVSFLLQCYIKNVSLYLYWMVYRNKFHVHNIVYNGKIFINFLDFFFFFEYMLFYIYFFKKKIKIWFFWLDIYIILFYQLTLL